MTTILVWPAAILLLIASIAKAENLGAFAARLFDRGIPGRIVLKAAFLIVAIEAAAAVALFTTEARSPGVWLAVAALTGSIGGGAMAMRAGESDCGCFGGWAALSPQRALVLSGTALALLAVAIRLEGTAEPQPFWAPALIVGACVGSMGLASAARGDGLIRPSPIRLGAEMRPAWIGGASVAQARGALYLRPGCARCDALAPYSSDLEAVGVRVLAPQDLAASGDAPGFERLAPRSPMAVAWENAVVSERRVDGGLPEPWAAAVNARIAARRARGEAGPPPLPDDGSAIF